MKVILETDGVEADAFLRDFVRVNLGFATWHHASVVAEVRVRLDGRKDRRGLLEFRCGIRAETLEHGAIQAGATGEDPCAALQSAANLFEVALFERTQPGPWSGARPLAA
jgi:hypothetical protein